MTNLRQTPELEICTGDIRSIQAAVLANADRVEICCALPLGGLTPQVSVMKLSEQFSSQIRRHLLIRPRQGDFLYDDDEMELMKADIADPSFARADGFVIGALRPDGSIDTKRVAELIRCASVHGDKSFTFHRAFDMCADPFRALEDIIELGFDRLLTSGCAPSAAEGIDTLRRLNEQADGRIRIMAGGGINAENARKIAEHTGITSFHASCSTRIESRMIFRNQSTHMAAGSSDEYTYPSSSLQLINDLSETVHSL